MEIALKANFQPLLAFTMVYILSKLHQLSTSCFRGFVRTVARTHTLRHTHTQKPPKTIPASSIAGNKSIITSKSTVTCTSRLLEVCTQVGASRQVPHPYMPHVTSASIIYRLYTVLDVMPRGYPGGLNPL